MDRVLQCAKPGVVLLVSADKIANVLAVVREISAGNLRLDPVILFFGERDRLANGSPEKVQSNSVPNRFFLVYIVIIMMPMAAR